MSDVPEVEVKPSAKSAASDLVFWAVMLLLTFLAGLVLGSGQNWPFNPRPDMRTVAGMYQPLTASPYDYGAPASIFEKKDRVQVYNYLKKQQVALDNLWGDYFQRFGLKKPDMLLFIVHEGSYHSKCSGMLFASTGVAAYCSEDSVEGHKGVIWLPLDSQPDEARAMYALMHENGHHIQDELREQLDLPDITGTFGGALIEKELIADCLAGVMANSFKRGGKLSEEQDKALLANVQYTGDYEHGTASERQSAYRLGFDTGTPLSCIYNFWVTL